MSVSLIEPKHRKLLVKKLLITIAFALSVALPAAAANLSITDVKKGDVFAGFFLDASGEVIGKIKESRPLGRDRKRYVFSFNARPPKGARKRCFVIQPVGKAPLLVGCLPSHVDGTLTAKKH